MNISTSYTSLDQIKMLLIEQILTKARCYSKTKIILTGVQLLNKQQTTTATATKEIQIECSARCARQTTPTGLITHFRYGQARKIIKKKIKQKGHE